jgi:hypothetical protein
MINKLSFFAAIAFSLQPLLCWGTSIDWAESAADKAPPVLSCPPVASFSHFSNADLLQKYRSLESHMNSIGMSIQNNQAKVEALIQRDKVKLAQIGAVTGGVGAVPYYFQFKYEENKAQNFASRAKQLSLFKYRQDLNEQACLTKAIVAHHLFSSAAYPKGGSVMTCSDYTDDLQLDNLDKIKAKQPMSDAEAQCLDSLRALLENKISDDLDQVKVEESSHPL